MATKATTKSKSTKAPAKRAPKADAGGSTGAGRNLVIVESPAKAKTIGRFLGRSYIVKASMGHVRDLPSGKLGVETDAADPAASSFAPDYLVMKDKKTIVADLKKAGDNASSIFLATDPDREGEAISWHLLEAAGWKNKPIRRVVFHAITPEAVKEAFENDREIDMRLVNAQQARRTLDRLVGYQLSPLLWKKVQRGTSAGRVQSVALRIVVERDAEVEQFVPVEYWSLEATLQANTGNAFAAMLHSMVGDKAKIGLPNGHQTESIASDLEGTPFEVDSVTKREVKRRPAAPFITSTLQQDSGRQLRFSANKAMNIAQQLYEGIDLGAEGTQGLITYMRTDSPIIDAGAIRDAREYIASQWGKEYHPESPRSYTSKSKVAQEAHEAIRPTSVSRSPESVRNNLTSDQFRLYDLIWKRTVASQMSDALLDSTRLEITTTGKSGQAYLFRASGSVMKFPGFRTLYMEAKDEEEAKDTDDEDVEKAEDRQLPALTKGQSLANKGLKPEQHFTQPPPRFTEASLIKRLEEGGIGRPSTYAPIIGVIVTRQYVTSERGTLKSTLLGQVVCRKLTGFFPDIVDVGFTAQLEDQLDEVANGKREWVPLLQDFYGPFTKALKWAWTDMPPERVEEPTDEICEKCGLPMVIKHGRFGQFLACSGFPDCKNSRPILKKTGVLCPVDGGELLERKSKGRAFFGCSNYPECKFTVSRRPLTMPCPECEGLLVVASRDQTQCTNCDWKGSVPEEETVGAA
jgi:DNA topoisomerase-1